MANPFFVREIPADAAFCDRVRELADLHRHAGDKANVVLLSPRRFGKTSLVRRVQKRLADEGAVTVYADFFGVGSVDEVAARLATAVFRVTHEREPLWEKAVRFFGVIRPVLRPAPDGGIEITAEAAGGKRGIVLLEDTMDSLGKFIASFKGSVHVALDEFQEIVTLPDVLKIEAALRTQIQRQDASYFFIGSRRRVLRGLFSDRQRPFFQSAFEYTLPPLPEAELRPFLIAQFRKGGLKCGADAARMITDLSRCHPYYAQKLAYLAHQMDRSPVTPEQVRTASEILIDTEKSFYEATVQGISPQQRLLLRALARESTRHPYSIEYVRKHMLGSSRSIQYGLEQLTALDLAGKNDAGEWNVEDPFFARWLTR